MNRAEELRKLRYEQPEFFMLVLGNVFGATGWGKWFPWSIVPMLAGMADPRVEVLAPSSIIVVGLTFVAGAVATIWQLRWADNAQ
jgi:ABC-2 type transport system permease protein